MKCQDANDLSRDTFESNMSLHKNFHAKELAHVCGAHTYYEMSLSIHFVCKYNCTQVS